MKKSGWRLTLSAVLLACWIGYLAYLSATTTHPIVLSRPQFLSADLYVIAEVPGHPARAEEPANLVKVEKVVWSGKAEDGKRTQLHVMGIDAIKGEFGWHGPGKYILALSRMKDDPDLFTVTHVPRTPGYQGDAVGRIYAATPMTLKQLELLTQEYHPANR